MTRRPKPKMKPAPRDKLRAHVNTMLKIRRAMRRGQRIKGKAA